MHLPKLFGKKESPAVEMGPLYPQVREAMLDVQAYARSHGGGIRLVSVSPEGDVTVQFDGACRGCPVADLTFRLGVEEQLRKLVPGVRRVIRVK